MTIEVANNKVYFIYRSNSEAQLAFGRLISLGPKYCSKGSEWNALMVDMEKMETMGGRQ